MRRKTVLILFLVIASVTSYCGRESAEPGPIPRPEHPRPDFVRERWLTLNGSWEFRFDPLDEGLQQEWWKPGTNFGRRINVPFGWESELSGVQSTGGEQIGWYRREVEIPSSWEGQHAWLRFDAIDWEARVWVSGVEVGRHEGGYTPFAFDITERATPGAKAEIVVRAYDPTDRELPTGKQVARWYTFTSGIWQTVWLEARPETYVESMSLVPKNDAGRWSLAVGLTISGKGPASLELSSPDGSFEAKSGFATIQGASGSFRTEIPVENPILWSPDNPHLYNLRISLSGGGGITDTVETYFGLRTIGRGRYGNAGHESILLNGEPLYLRGALDQSFNPQGIYTAPSDEFLMRDMELARAAGFNFLRIHIKPDEPRRLYWADKLGVLIMEDMPNAWEYSERSKQAWEATMREVIARDRNHPSIISWVLFNETWGLGTGLDYGDDFRQDSGAQQWVGEMWRLVKEELDPTRLVEDNSPNKFDHVRSDINSWHFYIDDYERARAHIAEVVESTRPGSTFNYVPGYQQDTAPLINSEYGAVSASGGDRDISFGFRYLTNELRKHEKIQGYIYTEFSDIEFEHNGIVNYDRTQKEFGYDTFVPDMTIAELQGADFIGYDAPPVIETEPGGVVNIPVFVSHFSGRTEPPTLNVWLQAVNDLGGEIKLQAAPKRVHWERFRVTRQEPVKMTVPELRDFAGAVGFELVDDEGKRIAANFVNVVARRDGAAPDAASGSRADTLDGRRTRLRIGADRFSRVSFDRYGPEVFARRGKFYAFGSGEVEYRFDVPQEVIDAGPVKLTFLAELATKAGSEKLAWPARPNPQDYPQTDGAKYPGSVEIRIGGEAVEAAELPDDPADARGVLSHLASFHHGSYGYLIKRNIDLTADVKLLERMRQDRMLRVVLRVPPGESAAGLSVYGDRTGRFPLDPTLIIETERLIGGRGADETR